MCLRNEQCYCDETDDSDVVKQASVFFGRASGKTAVIAATSADNGTGRGTDNSNGDSIDGPPALKICRALLVKGKSRVRFLRAALVFSK